MERDRAGWAALPALHGCLFKSRRRGSPGLAPTATLGVLPLCRTARTRRPRPRRRLMRWSSCRCAFARRPRRQGTSARSWSRSGRTGTSSSGTTRGWWVPSGPRCVGWTTPPHIVASRSARPAANQCRRTRHASLPRARPTSCSPPAAGRGPVRPGRGPRAPGCCRVSAGGTARARGRGPGCAGRGQAGGIASGPGVPGSRVARGRAGGGGGGGPGRGRRAARATE